MIEKFVGLWGIYGLKQLNPLQHFKNHSQLPNFFSVTPFLLTFASFQVLHSLSLQQVSYDRQMYRPSGQLRPETAKSLAKF